MKKLLFVFVGLLCSVGIFAQTNFQELSLEKAREQARAENKARYFWIAIPHGAGRAR